MATTKKKTSTKKATSKKTTKKKAVAQKAVKAAPKQVVKTTAAKKATKAAAPKRPVRPTGTRGRVGGTKRTAQAAPAKRSGGKRAGKTAAAAQPKVVISRVEAVKAVIAKLEPGKAIARKRKEELPVDETRYNPKVIEKKWQAKWDADQLYRSVIDECRPKHYALTMLPYPSGDLHIGHWYAMAPSDARAR